jgi:hypothetical protein
MKPIDDVDPEARDRIMELSCEMCATLDNADLSGMNTLITVKDEDGSHIHEFDVIVRKRRAGSKRGWRYNHTFLGYFFVLIQFSLTISVTQHVGFPLWKTILAVSFQTLVALVLTEIATKGKR